MLPRQVVMTGSCPSKPQRRILLAMATKKIVMKPRDTPSYGNKSEPPRKAVKEMMSKQSESSSKDALHNAKPEQNPKTKKAK